MILSTGTTLIVNSMSPFLVDEVPFSICIEISMLCECISKLWTTSFDLLQYSKLRLLGFLVNRIQLCIPIMSLYESNTVTN